MKATALTLYFDRLEPLHDLDNAELGQVFRAIWEYAESGTIPSLPRELDPFWKILRPSIDDGQRRFKQRSIKSRYSRFCGDCKAKGIQALSFTEWWKKQPDHENGVFPERC